MVRYGAGAMLMRLADEGARVVLVLLALERGDAAAVGGLLVAALLVPHVVAAPVLGLLVDRASRPEAVLAGAGAVFAAGLAVPAAALGRAPVAVCVLALLVAGCCGPALTGGLSGRLPALVAGERLPRAFGVDALTYDVAGIAGPAVGAVVAARAGAATAVVVLAAAAVAGATAVALLPCRADPDRADPDRADPDRADPAGADADHADRAGEQRALVAGLLLGARAIVADRTLAVVTAATSTAQLGFGALPVVVAVAADRRGDASTAGVLLVAMTVGGLVGSLLWTWRPAPPHLAARVVAVGLLLSGVGLGLSAAATSLAVLAALFALAGAADGPVLGALLVTRDRHAEPAARSQVFTLGAATKITAAAAGAAAIGLVAGAPTPVLIALAAAAPVLAGAAGLVALPPAAVPRETERPGRTAQDPAPRT